MKRYCMGIDEAGRGPLAGPVAVGFVLVPARFDVAKEFPGVRDSKKLREQKREKLYALLLEREKRGDVSFCVRFVTERYIDAHGISRAVRKAIASGVAKLAPSEVGVSIMLDGLLQAPEKYRQQTIVRGDDLVPVISLASIAAKVERDRLMKKLAIQYPEYGFEIHKGYGTERHRDAIALYGLCPIHRVTYCRAIDQTS